MKVKISGIFDPAHSWGVVNSKIADQAIFFKENVSISAICEYNNQHKITSKYIKYINYFLTNIDLEFSYTNPHNFKERFKSKGLRVAMTNYETNALPPHWSSFQNYCDIVFVNSAYSYENFLRAGFSEEKLEIIPLGCDVVRTTPLFQNGLFNFLNVSSAHSRKRLDQVVRCYYKAFQNGERVCLTIKTNKKTNNHFSVDIFEEIRKAQSLVKMKEYPKVQIMLEALDDMSPLYSACDCLISCSASEGFGLPLVEARSLGLDVIAPNYSGQKDFLNNKNSFLLEAKEVKAKKEFQYWTDSKDALVCEVKDEEVAERMRDVYSGSTRSDTDFKFKSWQDIYLEIRSHV